MKFLFWIIGLAVGVYVYDKIELGFIGLFIGVAISFIVQLTLNKIFMRKSGMDVAVDMMKNTNKLADKIFRETAEAYVTEFFKTYEDLKSNNEYKSSTDLHLHVRYEDPDTIEEGEGKINIQKVCSTIEGACYFGLLYLQEHIKELSAYRARQFIEYIDREIYKRDVVKQSSEDKSKILEILKLDSVKL